MKGNRMTVALRYRRVSGLGQEDNSSLEKQLDRIDEYCSLNDYVSKPEYLFTEVMTGVETWRERPELQKMLALAEQLARLDEAIVVVVDHPDRFARGMDLILLVELLLHYGVHVEFVQTKFEDTDEGHLILHLESYSSKKE
jgi:DNA invertase Pin-like site-specific DNA recombinase